MRVTRASRFNFAKRLENKARYKGLTINFLSIFTIVAGIYVLAYSANLDSNSVKFYGVFVIGLSVVSMFISLQDPISELSKKATNAHRCGREISHVYRRLEADQVTLSEASTEYEEILSIYEDNHKCDYYISMWEFRL